MPDRQMKNEQVLVIGAGPAGISCALQLRRHEINPGVFEKDGVGGLVKNANLIENYPGFPNGISGKKFTSLLRKQVKENGIEITEEEVLSVDYSELEKCFIVKTRESEYFPRMIVAASGTKPKTVPINIPKSVENKIFTEVKPLENISGKEISIVGAGDAAFDYALNLSRKNKVSIINRSDRIKCLPLLEERAGKKENISYMENTKLIEIGKINNRVKVQCLKQGKELEILREENEPEILKRGKGSEILREEKESEILKQGKGSEILREEKELEIISDYLIFAIGREPALDFLKNIPVKKRRKLEEKGLLYIIGDAGNSIYRQVSIAAGNGIMAGMKIAKSRNIILK